MRELEKPLEKLTPEIEVNQEKREETNFRLVGSLLVLPGHKLFGVNMDTLEVTIAAIEYPTVKMNKDMTVTAKKKVFYSPNIYYTSALNKENALKHYIRTLKKYKAKKQIVEN
jgi:hypothetical protein